MKAKPIASTPWLRFHDRYETWAAVVTVGASYARDAWLCSGATAKLFPASINAAKGGRQIRLLFFQRPARGRVQVEFYRSPVEDNYDMWTVGSQQGGYLWASMIALANRFCGPQKCCTRYVELEVK